MLIRPWFAPFIVAFWCATTGWLLIAKILPSLSAGPPPGYQALYLSDARPIPVAWSVLWNEQPLGWAVSEAATVEGGGITVANRMHLDRIPIDEILPSWTRLLFHRMIPALETPALETPGLDFTQGERDGLLTDGFAAPPSDPWSSRQGGESRFSLDARGSLSIRRDGQLEAFSSTVHLPGGMDKVVLDGMVDDGHVKIVIKARDIRYETSRHLPSTIILGDELSPQATMPGLEPGKRWTVPTYSPLRFGGSPIEVLHAHVAGEETMFWEDHLVRVNIVEYRDDPSSHHRPRSRIWVDRAGKVLKQESRLFAATLAFVRRSDAAAAALAKNISEP